ncbi:hypothetical protein LK540_02290 [Massilia sp. IC2-278]|uniref:hypothetical protein n=1 Tax=Massilia sp. IC2-278 TaxID=2887200 RepID=UPI001E4D93D8|nr:hypothetical protein [Massilia sp. IC2-278]MCC2959255.1 hypothetical protein [Massilia sp. IC2-278]
MRPVAPFWLAQRHGQTWRDEEILNAIKWLTSFVKQADWDRRIERVRRTFCSGTESWRKGLPSALFDPSDAVAWYIFQSNAYAQQRDEWFEPECFRIAPLFKRIGQILPELQQVVGIEERVARLMNTGTAQPDDGLFELLVAGAYKCRNWNIVEFVQEKPGLAKTHDLMVSSRRRRWAVECKRVNRSGYEAAEYQDGLRVAKPVHEMCRIKNSSLIVEVGYLVELSKVDENYLVERVEAFLLNKKFARWSDSTGYGQIRPVNRYLTDTVLAHDNVFFGSSRMVELLAGQYLPYLDHSVVANWTPAITRPLHASVVNQASVVSWLSMSINAAQRKAKHFRSLVAKAEQQLPADCPGVIHVGYEARGGNSVDELRHALNDKEMKNFVPESSRLRWVYGNYLMPEHTNNPNESSALSETTATYKIGKHTMKAPLPSHLLFDSGMGEPGTHW